MRCEGGLAQIFPLPLRGNNGERTYEATIQEQQQREDAVPEEPEEPSAEETLSQPGTGPRFDVFTQSGESEEDGPGDAAEGDGGPRRRVHQKTTNHIEEDNEVYNISSEE